MARNEAGILIVAVGVVLTVVGLLVWFGGLSWFGRLPGDIRIVRPTMRVYVPITSMLLVSVVLSAILVIIRRLR